jgi:hypothetical protein
MICALCHEPVDELDLPRLWHETTAWVRRRRPKAAAMVAGIPEHGAVAHDFCFDLWRKGIPIGQQTIPWPT